jgi:hypothetical protein
MGEAEMSRLGALASFLMFVACSQEPRPAPNVAPAPVATDATGSNRAAVLVAKEAEAKNAIGKRVRVEGIAEREKLGDTVASPGFSVTCLKPRFPDGRIDRPITVEGVLERESFAATQRENGLISQGTEPGTWTYVIHVCTVR